ncbi:deoxynucleotidyltransferase terminal-interacting protein 2 [Teleopsis dalmanni]|uniref:deoxynucleotidyltransferase terminal-interacting protein 2 n=1 Tax=Teleopsis dalmanni TaxID=139649 RepID=UPI0018CD7AAB|nr:deoxynucleotidyltransferase terminal-interacting protein 2 [Teleopsis dalmanni]
MALFVIDTIGDNNLVNYDTKRYDNLLPSAPVAKRNKSKQKSLPATTTLASAKDVSSSDSSTDDEDYFGLPPPNVDVSDIISDTLAKTEYRDTTSKRDLKDVGALVEAAIENAKSKKETKRRRIVDLDHSSFNPYTGKFDDLPYMDTNVKKELAKSEVVNGLETLKELPRLNKKKQRDLNRIERSKTKGNGWYNLPATEMTEEVENDLKVLQMRSVLDPKRFYKKNDLKVLPKYFQIGTVQHSPLDYYSERNTRKNKKKSLVDELLADEQFQTFTKRKYNENIERKNKYKNRKALKKMKKLKKRK